MPIMDDEIRTRMGQLSDAFLKGQGYYNPRTNHPFLVVLILQQDQMLKELKKIRRTLRNEDDEDDD